MIRTLHPSDVRLLRSSVTITSHAQAVEELVLNSVDAGSTKISVRIDPTKYSITCEDDGCGISENSMEVLGQPWSTSKCHSLDELDGMSQACTFGFRGQAVSSLVQISSCEIVTQARDTPLKWSKSFRGGKVLRCCPLVTVQRSNTHHRSQRHNGGNGGGNGNGNFKGNSNDNSNGNGNGGVLQHQSGTVVYVRDLFFNTPVRRKRLDVRKELTEARERMRRISLVHPKVEFILIDEASSKTLLRVLRRDSIEFGRCRGLKASFDACYGRNDDWNLQERTLSWYGKEGRGRCVAIHAIVSSWGRGTKSKDMQWLYVNRRYVRSSKIGKLMNNMLGTTRFAGNEVDRYDATTRSTSANSIWPVYVLCLTMSAEMYDVLSEPDKTNIICHDMEYVLEGLKYMFDVGTSAAARDGASWRSAVSPQTSPLPPLPPSQYRPYSRKRHQRSVDSVVGSGEVDRGYRSVFAEYTSSSSSSSSFVSTTYSSTQHPRALKKTRRSIADMLNQYQTTQIKAVPNDRVRMLSSLPSSSFLPSSTARYNTMPNATEGGKSNSSNISSSSSSSNKDNNNNNNNNDNNNDAIFGNEHVEIAHSFERASSIHGGNIALTSTMVRSCFLIGQADKKFLLLRSNSDGSLFCVDQHAAAERVELEVLEQQFQVGAVGAVSVLSSYAVDETVSLRPREEEEIAEYNTELKKWKFEVELVEDERDQEDHKKGEDCKETGSQSLASLFARNTQTFIANSSSNSSSSTTTTTTKYNNNNRLQHNRRKLHVKALPTLFGIQLSIGDMRIFLHELREANGRILLERTTARRPTFVTRCLNSLACKRAIKFGHTLTRLECIDLMDKLMQTKLPFQCAHGRPTVVPVALGDISCGISHVWKRKQKSETVTN